MTETVNGGVTIKGFRVCPDNETGLLGSLVINLTDGYTREELISSLSEQVRRIKSVLTNRFYKFDVDFVLPNGSTLFSTFQTEYFTPTGGKVIWSGRDTPEDMKVIEFAEEIHRTFFSQN